MRRPPQPVSEQEQEVRRNQEARLVQVITESLLSTQQPSPTARAGWPEPVPVPGRNLTPTDRYRVNIDWSRVGHLPTSTSASSVEYIPPPTVSDSFFDDMLRSNTGHFVADSLGADGLYRDNAWLPFDHLAPEQQQEILTTNDVPVWNFLRSQMHRDGVVEWVRMCRNGTLRVSLVAGRMGVSWRWNR